MIKKWLVGLMVMGFVPLFAQKAPSEVIMTINNEPIQKQEFEYIFKKNSKDSAVTKEDLDEYVDLFIKFKLKVKEAEALGLHKDPKFIEELQGYRKQLSKPYFTDPKLNEGLLKEAYERTIKEVKASHILIKVGPNASPEDTLKAYNKILKIKKSLGNSKMSFEDVARKSSEDPSAKDNGGNLGYFSAFQMVYPFETAAYNTPVGKVSDPIRSDFGYHLVYVTDVRDALGSIRLSHIMLSTQGKSEKQKQEAEARIKEIKELLNQGESFEELAKKHSEDKSTSANGGSMNWITGGKMIEEFETVAFSLKEDGEISEPFETIYGWHIVRRDQHKPTASYEELLPVLKRKVSKDQRGRSTEEMFVENKKKELGFKLYKGTLKKIGSAIDSTVLEPNQMFAKKVDGNKKLFKLDNFNYATKDYLYWLAENAKDVEKDISWNEWNKNAFNKYISEKIISYIDENLEKNHPDFKSLMNEYRDGILLFELTDSLVWSKAVKDTAGLEAFYEKNKSDFVWNERIVVDRYVCANKEYADKVLDMLAKGKTITEIVNSMDDKSKLAMKAETVKFEKEKDELPKGVEWKLGQYGPFTKYGQHKIFVVREFTPPSQKELHEAKGLITAAYQDYLEKTWLDELKKKYKVELNKEVLYSIK